MKPATLLGLIALVPSALNVSSAAQGAILMPMCSGDGSVQLVPLPGGGQPPTGGENGCCIKGCHSGSQRKRFHFEIEPAQ